MSDKKRFIDWGEFESAVASIAHSQIREPDIVVGIARGGLPGGVLLSHLFDAEFNAIWATHYSGEDRNEEVVVENYGLNGASEDQKILLFDDIVDTGETMDEITTKWDEQDSLDLNYETASIHVKPHSGFVPDYWIAETDDWIVYPWEAEL